MIRHRDNRTMAIDFTAAQERAEVGIERSARHANRVESEWTGQALGMLTAFLRVHDGPFLMEEARSWAEAHGLPAPPDKRSWGSIARTAAAKKRIRKVGAAAAASSNNSLKVLWEPVHLSLVSVQ